ncbi:MAG TPA: hypothetical protein VF533_04965 [Solirubrobacteraceae bacterium]|jgi:hypothetical protein
MQGTDVKAQWWHSVPALFIPAAGVIAAIVFFARSAPSQGVALGAR